MADQTAARARAVELRRIATDIGDDWPVSAEILRDAAGDLDRLRAELCKALAISHDSTWEYVISDARSAGIVRDAEYRHVDKVYSENERLRVEVQRQRAELVQFDGIAGELNEATDQLDELRARARHIAEHDPRPEAAGAALRILGPGS